MSESKQATIDTAPSLGLNGLRELHHKLGSLLADPQPGLFTWTDALSTTLMDMANYAGHGYVSAFPDTLAACEAVLPKIQCHSLELILIVQTAIAKAKGEKP